MADPTQDTHAKEPGFVTTVVLLAVVYVATARIGQQMAMPPGNITPVWLPSGLMLAALMRLGLRYWPGVFAGAFVGNIWAYFDSGSTVGIVKAVGAASLNGVGDSLCVAVAVWLMGRFASDPKAPQNSTGGMLALVIAAAVGPAISALFGVLGLAGVGILPWDKVPLALATWTTGDGVGMLVLTPMVLVLWEPWRPIAWSLEHSLWAALLVVMGMLTLDVLPPPAPAVLVVLLPPPALWAAVRFEPRLAFGAVVGLSGLLVLATALRLGPFSDETQLVGLLYMQLFVAVVSANTLLVVAVVAERQAVQDKLLSSSEERFKTLVTNSEGIIYMIDRDGTFLLSEGRLLAKLGLEPGQVVGGNVKDLYKDFPDMLAAMERAFEGEHVVFEVDVGGIVFLSWYSPHYDANGDVLGLLGMSIDITQRRAAERELQRALTELGRSNRELEQFAYVASHDLREPLRMVASYTELLRRRYSGQLDEKADRFIGHAVEGAKRMEQLINDLLEFSRVGTRTKPLSPTPVSEVVAVVLQTLEKALEESGGEVVVGDLPTVMADRTQLRQVFQNLVANAIKFHGEAPPQVHITAERDNGMWAVTVADNGIGIEPKFFERVFEIFQRLHGREKYAGSGIGLAIVKKIVERHGGEVSVESCPGAGTRFTFTLPAVVEAAPSEESA